MKVAKQWIFYDKRMPSLHYLGTKDTPGKAPKIPLLPKEMLLTSLWSSVVIHYSSLSRKKTINAARYCTDMHHRHGKLCLKEPARENRYGQNTSDHVRKCHLYSKFRILEYEIVPHSSYSPDILKLVIIFPALEPFFCLKKFIAQFIGQCRISSLPETLIFINVV